MLYAETIMIPSGTNIIYYICSDNTAALYDRIIHDPFWDNLLGRNFSLSLTIQLCCMFTLYMIPFGTNIIYM